MPLETRTQTRNKRIAIIFRPNRLEKWFKSVERVRIFDKLKRMQMSDIVPSPKVPSECVEERRLPSDPS